MANRLSQQTNQQKCERSHNGLPEPDLSRKADARIFEEQSRHLRISMAGVEVIASLPTRS